MTRGVLRRVAALLGVLILLGMAALAQDPGGGDGPDDNGFIIDFLQNRISAPGRQIRLEGVSGALSSRARIAGLTVSDERGVWLRLEGVEIDWSRRQLLLRRVSINRLAVERIVFLRRPVAPERGLADRLPQIEAQPFSLPELPVSLRIAALELPRIELEPAALGQAATLSATGAADLARGELEASLAVRRIDGPGGELDLAVDFSNATGELALDIDLEEPQGGVVATLLDIENRPAIDLSLQGAGPLDALDVDFAFDAGGARIAAGKVALRGSPLGTAFAANFSGGLAPVVPAPYRDFFAGNTAVELRGVNLAAGGLRLDRFALSGAALELTGALETAADGFPRNLTLSGRLGDPRGPAVTLPVPGASTSIHSAVLHLAYGAGRRWNGLVALDRLKAGDIEIEDLTLTLGGLAENLDIPERRNLTFALEGVATGVWSEDPDVAAVLGTRLDLFADAALPPGGPLTIRQAQVGGNGVALFAAGDLRGFDFDGRIAAQLADLAPAAGLAGRDLGGALDLLLVGSISPLSGGFDLALDGSAEDLRLGDPRLDGLLDGVTALDGRVARDAEGFRTDGFRLANPQVAITSSGRLSSDVTDLAIDVALTDLGALDPRLAGALTATGRATGTGRPIAVDFEAAIPEGRLLDRELRDARLGFEGEVDGADVRGALTGGGALGDQPITLAGEIELAGGNR
nr:translocation/assembly module TamB [Paracoccaceae bacterium]